MYRRPRKRSVSQLQMRVERLQRDADGASAGQAPGAERVTSPAQACRQNTGDVPSFRANISRLCWRLPSIVFFAPRCLASAAAAVVLASRRSLFTVSAASDLFQQNCGCSSA